MVDERRFEFTASKSTDLVLEIDTFRQKEKRSEMDFETELKVIGSGTGVQAAALFCRYIHQRTQFKRKVGFLLGIF